MKIEEWDKLNGILSHHNRILKKLIFPNLKESSLFTPPDVEEIMVRKLSYKVKHGLKKEILERIKYSPPFRNKIERLRNKIINSVDQYFKLIVSEVDEVKQHLTKNNKRVSLLRRNLPKDKQAKKQVKKKKK